MDSIASPVKCCPACQQDLPLDNFPVINRHTGERSARCATCKRDYEREWRRAWRRRIGMAPRRTKAVKVRPTPADRFWARVAQGDGCWEWQGQRQPTGYGRLQWNKEQAYAHRVAYELTHGPIPAGLFVCHSCDNPPCCNPAHLWLGTAADNVRDRDAKGRHRWGTYPRRTAPPVIKTKARRRMTHAQMQEAALQVRQRYAQGGISARQLAKELGYDHTTVLDILRGKYRY